MMCLLPISTLWCFLVPCPKGAAAVAVNVPEKQFSIFALAGISAEQEGQRTGSERCPGEADLPGPEFRGRRAPSCPACGIGKGFRSARGSRDDAPSLPMRRTPKPRSLHHHP
ncbi:Sortilin-Related Receptor [Manis pentadactyla]|nr:Sortilin-Related Receptor [Manis pentadactyla]